MWNKKRHISGSAASILIFFGLSIANPTMLQKCNVKLMEYNVLSLFSTSITTEDVMCKHGGFGVGRDSPLPDDKKAEWMKWRESLQHLQELEIPRRYSSSFSPSRTVLADASVEAT